MLYAPYETTPPLANVGDLSLIAVVLPQFHPIPENDTWWGRGFTEWTNVAKARPQFPGHHQPQLPADLGFYDLRLPETRAAQADLAKEFAISGFCYYHYWFDGKRILNRPLDDLLTSGEPSFPFCLAWANENWTRTWDGRQREVLMEQKYSNDDDDRHIETLLPFFADTRYIRIGGRPLFVVYKANDLPHPQRTFDRWRQRALISGVGELCLAQFEASGAGSAPNPLQIGLDLSIEFAPDWRSLGGQYYVTRKARIAMAMGLLPKAYSRHRVFEYELMVQKTLAKPDPAYPFIRCVSPGFDNSPRRPERGATILRNNTPERYEEWLNKALVWADGHRIDGRRIVFLNAWNEWAEGNHLEPDMRNGRAFLEATRRAQEANRKPPQNGPPVERTLS